MQPTHGSSTAQEIQRGWNAYLNEWKSVEDYLEITGDDDPLAELKRQAADSWRDFETAIYEIGDPQTMSELDELYDTLILKLSEMRRWFDELLKVQVSPDGIQLMEVAVSNLDSCAHWFNQLRSEVASFPESQKGSLSRFTDALKVTNVCGDEISTLLVHATESDTLIENFSSLQDDPEAIGFSLREFNTSLREMREIQGALDSMSRQEALKRIKKVQLSVLQSIDEFISYLENIYVMTHTEIPQSPKELSSLLNNLDNARKKTTESFIALVEASLEIANFERDLSEEIEGSHAYLKAKLSSPTYSGTDFESLD